mmetsp:Transcript_27031/g.31253  ORF Transcript_27031/g.31253 Transcript_27031/m.31253 type:complete len:339 (-) Transcript_27031:500-1516(-)|eukprot:CAMPEP_0194356212 /NCGR_PEP_ID=MMETSP0174-20130528/3939_1 /TAXON_ID=216777 /ORGANISM="Proboscia alata, Strain PI-D3" /LENGTH=338 /DNA_ID=CAMNT_0039125735 /DNA_START=61 /DNA_END=1077 /DNA_ORIENTATION=+
MLYYTESLETSQNIHNKEYCFAQEAFQNIDRVNETRETPKTNGVNVVGEGIATHTGNKNYSFLLMDTDMLQQNQSKSHDLASAIKRDELPCNSEYTFTQSRNNIQGGPIVGFQQQQVQQAMALAKAICIDAEYEEPFDYEITPPNSLSASGVNNTNLHSSKNAGLYQFAFHNSFLDEGVQQQQYPVAETCHDNINIQREKSIPIHGGKQTQCVSMPRSHIPRTRSEIQLHQDNTAAEYRDICMYNRLTTGIHNHNTTGNANNVLNSLTEHRNEILTRVASQLSLQGVLNRAASGISLNEQSMEDCFSERIDGCSPRRKKSIVESFPNGEDMDMFSMEM